MLHRPVVPPTGTLRRIRAALAGRSLRTRTIDEIHPAWCTCSDCTLDSKRTFRLELLIIAAAVAAALVGAGVSYLEQVL